MHIFLSKCLISIYFMGFHPFYVGITEINYNESSHSLEITLRFFTDDFENALSKHSDMNILLTHEDALQKYAPQIERYIKEKLEIILAGKKAHLNYVGSESDEEAIWTYLEVKNIREISEVLIRNEIFFELFDTQMHLVHFNVAGKKKSYQLNRRKPEAKFSR
jgi:vacuolar-type H+-ATPase subunit F/Vma7